MESLLSKRTRRHLNIIYHLANKQESLDFSDIMQLNQCSHKTAYEDISNIQSNYGEWLGLVNDHTLFKATSATTNDIVFIKKDYYKEEVTINLLQALFLFPYKKVADYANMLDVSESTVLQRMKVLSSFMEDFATIKKETDANVYYIDATDELQFQYFISRIIIETEDAESINEYIPTIDDEHFKSQQEVYYNFMTRDSTEIPEFISFQLKLLKAIEYARYQQGYLLPNSFIENLITSEQPIQDEEQLHVDRLFKRYGIELLNEEIKTIMLILNMYLCKSLVIKKTVDYKYSRFRIFRDELEEDNPLIIKTVINMIEQIDHELNTHLSAHINEILFALFTNIQNMRMYRQYHFAIISDLGNKHAESLQTFLYKHFPLHQFTVLDETRKHPLNSYDFVIINTVTIENSYPDYHHFIRISDYPNQRDLKILYESFHLLKRQL